ncbi:uncharacterized protein LOC129410327 isoform X3 [Boleophthalmus pectinirostris]|uniref:uncharacterized protein LOC129410327 isoform X3 n=1 Tax=Boleophthalmus pectinirostris TaxID=150288 RepID=UPI00242B09DB|nr:uncharacterized protein LOC129410327 isoform X3 [Boleophthalmus pectinirostris]
MLLLVQFLCEADKKEKEMYHTLTMILQHTLIHLVLEATHVQQVSGHTGDELSIHCFSHWTSNGSNSQYTMIFCKGPCSNENLLVKKNESGIIQRGRYKMENSTALFSVTIRRLNRTDAGRYFCELQLNDSVLYQEVLVTVLEGTPAPFVSVPNDITVQTATLSWDYLSSSTVPPVSTSGGSDKKPTSSLTEEQTVSTGGNKPGVGHRDEHIDVPLAQTAVALQTDPDLEAPDAAQYASVYQALDPQSLD